MSDVNKKRLNPIWTILLILFALYDFALVILYLLRDKNIALLNPKGLIAQEQFNLMTYTVAILFAIAIPSVFLLYFVAWKYRESNTKAAYNPNIRHGKWFNFKIWAIPSVFILVLAFVMLPATQRLEPKRAIASDRDPITIQVIAMRWKWLFIYPEQGVASVNFVQIPVNTPVEFELTADEAPMSSFWIPNLGGQLYAMTSHVNRLNLMAETTGDYTGRSAEINGAGFSGMTFTARASSPEGFDQWVQEVKRSPDVLSSEMYDNLVKPSENNPIAAYSSYESDLYDNVILKYSESGAHINH